MIFIYNIVIKIRVSLLLRHKLTSESSFKKQCYIVWPHGKNDT